jgi:hypothetical protein
LETFWTDLKKVWLVHEVPIPRLQKAHQEIEDCLTSANFEVYTESDHALGTPIQPQSTSTEKRLGSLKVGYDSNSATWKVSAHANSGISLENWLEVLQQAQTIRSALENVRPETDSDTAKGSKTSGHWFKLVSSIRERKLSSRSSKSFESTKNQPQETRELHPDIATGIIKGLLNPKLEADTRSKMTELLTEQLSYESNTESQWQSLMEKQDRYKESIDSFVESVVSTVVEKLSIVPVVLRVSTE